MSYLRVMRSALPLYDRLQDEVVSACADVQIVRMLDLGAGTGETSRRCLIAHPGATVVALDASEAMLEMAKNVLAHDAELRLARLEDPLPEGRFDLIVSVLAVHHLDRAGKADLFKRVANRLAPAGGLFKRCRQTGDSCSRGPAVGTSGLRCTLGRHRCPHWSIGDAGDGDRFEILNIVDGGCHLDTDQFGGVFVVTPVELAVGYVLAARGGCQRSHASPRAGPSVSCRRED